MNNFILRFHPSNFALHRLLITCAGLLTTVLILSGVWQHGLTNSGVAVNDEDEVDRGLQRAAETALADREGTIIVMDAQNGRIRAIANPRMATEQAFAPGSTIKPFAALTALRSGLITKESRLLCHGGYKRGDSEMKCAHPKELAPFSPAQALAYSCNNYFGELGERISENAFNRTLTTFGFGSRTGFGPNEATGQLPRGSRATSNTLGEGDSLLVTPVQLISAYDALVNGGHLYAPRQASSTGFISSEQAQLDIAPLHREILIDGMRGAVEYGTAEKVGLTSLPLNIIGKTGTSTASESGRTQGWFVGIATDQIPPAEVSPDRIKLVVLVFLKRGHGADSASASRIVFEEFARVGSGSGGSGGSDRIAPATADIRKTTAPERLADMKMPVRVHMVRENETRTMSLEDYVLGVVAAEGSVEVELESLKALAVASRTYALKNLHRHRDGGYDFCTLTHCQRYVSTNVDDARRIVVRAVRETEGEVLRDTNNQIIESYFSASCGGMTADIHTLWGVAPKSYLRGTRDPNCDGAPNSSWTDVIPAEHLAAALRGDPRSDVGSKIDQVRILKRDATGRAELIEIYGDRRRTLRGWDFKIIVGRALGWNLLKSSRFEVSRSGSDFVFRGSGFGHGLGLCQEGAHVMATNGIGYRQILARYFPGTSLRRENLERSI